MTGRVDTSPGGRHFLLVGSSASGNSSRTSLYDAWPEKISDEYRLYDLAAHIYSFIGALLLLALLAPFFLLIAAAIKIESKGPAYFKQQRHGRGSRIFNIYKFRTMHTVESGSAAVQCNKNDPRVTRIGALLRRASLDELPQLINVLRFEMVLVGPRPHALNLDWEFAPLIVQYSRRYAVTPGITGLAQIRGFRGPTRTLLDMKTRINSDIEYVNLRSVPLDLRILAKTAPAVFLGRNAF